jgi:hypothetical protein
MVGLSVVPGIQHNSVHNLPSLDKLVGEEEAEKMLEGVEFSTAQRI